MQVVFDNFSDPIVPPHETQHTSLKRTKDPPAPQLPLYSPILERSEVYLLCLMIAIIISFCIIILLLAF